MIKRDRLPTRSDKYQYIICEVSVSDEFLGSFCNNDSIASQLNPYGYDERIFDLVDELKKLFWEIADQHMTDRQKQVMHMRADGYTQMEIADMLGVNQSSITKSINGNVDYKNVGEGGKAKVYGGAIKKLKKVMDKHPRIQEILLELSELRSDKY